MSSITTTTSQPTPTTAGEVTPAAPILVTLDPTAGSPSLRFSEPTTTSRFTIPLDRRTPHLRWVVSDQAGGMVVAAPAPNHDPDTVMWWQPGATDWVAVSIPGFEWSGSKPTVVQQDSGPALLYVTREWTDYHDADRDIDVAELHSEVRLQPFDGTEGTVLLTADTVTTHRQGEYQQAGTSLVHATAGGDALFVLWESATSACRWLGVIPMADQSDPLVGWTPYPEGSCTVNVNDVMVSRDGRLLISTEGYGEETHVALHDLATETLVATWAAPWAQLHFDGVETLAVIGDSPHPHSLLDWSMEVGTISANGFDAARYGPSHNVTGVVGVIPRLPTFPGGLTLASTALTMPCSGAGLELEPDSTLPQAVAATRDAIGRAAATCHFETLAELTDRLMVTHESGVCGDEALLLNGDRDPVPDWYAAEQIRPAMGGLLQALQQSPTLRDGDQGLVYTWTLGRHTIEIDEAGHWILHRYVPEVPPCETIWCTC